MLNLKKIKQNVVTKLIDTWEIHSYINLSFAIKNNLDHYEITNSTAETANWTTILINKDTDIDLDIEGDNRIIYKIKVRHFDKLNTNLILWIEFLQKIEAIIKFKKNTITPDGKYHVSNFYFQSEQYSINKTKIMLLRAEKNKY